MRVLLTGAAGFLGYHAARRFLERGDSVVGVDVLSDYYAVSLKEARLAELERFDGFAFRRLDLAAPNAMAGLSDAGAFDVVVHLAAQAGVRHSIDRPFAYVDANVTGQVAVLEFAARAAKKLPVVYASSSSVYGANEKVPFSETDRTDSPVSLYAATKKAGELLAHVYAGIHGLRTVGLRFFTVYGRYGRPDMAPWLFTGAILAGRPIPVFNHGNMERDFTHVSDIVSGIVAAADRIVSGQATEPVYNLGNSSPVRLMDFIAAIEAAAGRKAEIEFKPKPAGDVTRTYADIALAARDLGFQPAMPLAEGIADFVDWFRGYDGGP